MLKLGDDVTLYQGDCLEIMPALEAGSVDAIITDLPYGTTACAWDSVIPFEPMWEQVERILKPVGAFVTTASQPFTSKVIMSNLARFRYGWVWKKTRRTRFLDANRRPLLEHEDILIFGNGTHTYNPQMLVGSKHKRGSLRPRGSDSYGKFDPQMYESNLWFPGSVIEISVASESCITLSQCPSRRDVHPTEKPVALYDYLVRTYTNLGDVVCDITMGSGTTGVACVQTGRKFVGIEIDQGYFDIAVKRISDALAQPPLFRLTPLAADAAGTGTAEQMELLAAPLKSNG
jgi:DNA modification methylase